MHELKQRKGRNLTDAPGCVTCVTCYIFLKKFVDFRPLSLTLISFTHLSFSTPPILFRVMRVKLTNYGQFRYVK